MTYEGELLTATEVADRLRISRSTLSRWVRNGELPAIRLPGGRALRFRPADVDALLAPEPEGQAS